jgi:hypothetical protein
LSLMPVSCAQCHCEQRGDEAISSRVRHSMGIASSLCSSQ